MEIIKETTGVNNIISIAIGIIVILFGCFIAYSFQKHLFRKYNNKVENIINKDNKNNS